MKPTLLRLWMAAAATAVFAHAQNSDLGLLLGVTVPIESNRPPDVFHWTKVYAGGEVNYARQLRETVAGSLYLEFPVIITSGVQFRAGQPGVTVSASDTVFFTPGLRWKFSPARRLSFYAAAGGGLASISRAYAADTGAFVVADVGRITTGAFGYGVGVDLRATRLVSFRMEARDHITRGNIDMAVHHPSLLLGVGLHF